MNDSLYKKISSNIMLLNSKVSKISFLGTSIRFERSDTKSEHAFEAPGQNKSTSDTQPEGQPFSPTYLPNQKPNQAITRGAQFSHYLLPMPRGQKSAPLPIVRALFILFLLAADTSPPFSSRPDFFFCVYTSKSASSYSFALFLLLLLPICLDASLPLPEMFTSETLMTATSTVLILLRSHTPANSSLRNRSSPSRSV